MWHSRGIGTSAIGRTEEERDRLPGSDVGGEDRLRVDAREEEAKEAIEDSREREEEGGGVASLESEERARLARRWVCAYGDLLFVEE
jgi:hypothetical protein